MPMLANKDWYDVLALVVRGVRGGVLAARNLTIFFELFASVRQKKDIDLLYSSLLL